MREIHPNELINFYRGTIGMVFQAFYLIQHLSAKDNMMLSKMFSGVPVHEREKRAEELMDKFGITPFADHKPGMMSGGQQQRTAIGRSLMNNPEIILADEPVGNLDSKNSEIVLELLADINKKEKKTIIQVTHNPKDTHYADRVFYMKDGAIERVVSNTRVGENMSPKDDTSEFDKLAHAHPDLAHSRLQAKLMMRSILMPYDFDTEEKIELVIEKYIKKEISKDGLLKFIDDSKQGAGLYAQKARRVAELIDDSVRELRAIDNIRLSESDDKKRIESEEVVIRKHLLDRYVGTLSIEQICKLDLGISARISGQISEQKLKEFMGMSQKSDGVGLNRLTAKKFCREVELMISK